VEKENESDEKKEEENPVNELKVFACLAAEERCCGGSGDGEWMENDGPWLLKWSAIELSDTKSLERGFGPKCEGVFVSSYIY
jgi:hypothetical protein